MRGIELRRAGAGDAPALAALARAAYGPWEARLGVRPLPMDADYDEAIREHSVWIAEIEGRPAGLLVLGEDAEGFFIDNVAVAPAHQGTGIGRSLLGHAEREARAAGFGSIYLWTHERMTENLAIYEARGYVEFDRRSPRPGAPAFLVYMRKPLP